MKVSNAKGLENDEELKYVYTNSILRFEGKDGNRRTIVNKRYKLVKRNKIWKIIDIESEYYSIDSSDIRDHMHKFQYYIETKNEDYYYVDEIVVVGKKDDGRAIE